MTDISEVLISIIIPVFNLDKYIGECIESIQRQTFQDFEMILVDDGSVDESTLIIGRYMQYDDRIKLISLKENKGAGYARNKGLDVAKGKYLLFLDGDDFFKETMLEKLYTACENQKADIAVCNLFFYDNKTHISTRHDETKNFDIQDKLEGVFTLADISDCAFQFMHEIAWNKMFLREFVMNTGIKFQCQHNANDQFFVFANLLEAKRIIMLPDALIYYRQNIEGQLSQSVMKSPMCIWNATKETFQYMFERGYLPLYSKSIHTYIIKRLIFSLNKVNESNRKYLFEFYREEGLKELMMDCCISDDFNDLFSYNQYFSLKTLKYSSKILQELGIEINWDPYRIDMLFRYLTEINANAVLWGIGKNGKKLLEQADRNRYRFRMLVDKNTEKAGEKIGGYIVKSAEEVTEGDLILITNSMYIQKIKKELSEKKKKCKLIDVCTFLCFKVKIESVIFDTF